VNKGSGLETNCDLPQGLTNMSFLLLTLFEQACPLIEVCDTGSPHPVGVAVGADLRTDLPK
jgi:uncharacterized protein YcsI (UPF0317 family)